MFDPPLCCSRLIRFSPCSYVFTFLSFCVRDLFSDSSPNTDTRIKWTLWYVPWCPYQRDFTVCVRVPFKRIAFDPSGFHVQLQVGLVFVRHGNNFSWTSLSDDRLLFAALHEDPYFLVTSEENLAPVKKPLPTIAQMSSFCSCSDPFILDPRVLLFFW